MTNTPTQLAANDTISNFTVLRHLTSSIRVVETVWARNAIHALIGIMRPIVRYDGICIILVTVIVRGLMFPISRRQQASMARTQEQMAKVAPELKKLKEKHKGDSVAMQQAQMELYRKHGINPAAGLGGCLMLMLQMPIFMGLSAKLFRLLEFVQLPILQCQIVGAAQSIRVVRPKRL